MRFVITGGAGFIGRRLALYLARQGKAVAVYDPAPIPDSLVQLGVQQLIFDPMGPTPTNSIFVRDDVVFHLAWRGFPGVKNRTAYLDVTDNVLFSLRLLQATVDKGISRFIFVSSGGAVYGANSGAPISEDHPTNPISAYGICKLTVERFVSLSAEEYGFQWAIARPGNAYGAGQPTESGLGAVATFVERAAKKLPLTIIGDGSVVRDYVHVDDVVTGLALLGQTGTINGIFNLGTGVGTSISRLVSMVLEHCVGPIDVINTAPRHTDVPCIILNSERLQRAVGWTPKIDLEAGILQQWMVWRNSL